MLCPAAALTVVPGAVPPGRADCRIFQRPAAAGWRARSRPEMSYTTLTVPGMNEPPSRYDVTVRVARDDGRQPGPAAFAVAASQAASSSNAGVVSAHTASRGDHLRSLRRRAGSALGASRRPGCGRRRAQG